MVTKHDTRPSRLNLGCCVVARLCLLLSLWQAPIPWLHSHGTDATVPSSHVAARELSDHLATYHQALVTDEGVDLGWHCHWVMPFWNHLFHKDSKDELPSQKSFAFDSATISMTQAESCCVSWADCEWIGRLLKDSVQREWRCVERFERRDPDPRADSFSILRC